MRPGYPQQTRQWALDYYRSSRVNYPSRAACVAAIAVEIGAHVNTVAHWIAAEHGPARKLTADDAPAKLAAAAAEIERLKRENRTLQEQLDTAFTRATR